MITERLKNTILKTLEIEDFDIQDGTHAYEIKGWDSLRHISVIVAIEEEYGIRLSGREVRKLQNIGELQELVNSKIV